MAAHSNDKTILGDGLKWNVRSYLYEKVVDFSLMEKVDASAYYEVGALPRGFVPRNVAIVELARASDLGEVKVYSTVEDVANGSATEVASLNVGGADLGFAAKAFADMDATLALKAGVAFTGGKIKVAVSGDMMTGHWDEALGTSGEFDPADGVSVNATDRATE